MLRKVDRILIRVPGLQSAVKHYRDVLGMKLTREEANLASFQLSDSDTELVLHTDEDLPDQAIYFLVEDVRELYRRRDALSLKFSAPPTQTARGYRATVKDPFGNVLLVLDRTMDSPSSRAVVEDAKGAGTGGLFAGVPQRVTVKREALIAAYEKIGRTADDLPYTPHFESLYSGYADQHGEPRPTRAEVWRHLLNLRKAGKLPKLGEARSKPPNVSEEDRAALRTMLGEDIGKRDRLPYTERFDALVDEFNRTQTRPLSPHLVWRLVATLAK